VDESWVYVEIDDDGELYATTLERTLQPIVRYRLGDRAEWIGEPCDCGRKAPRFRLMGRSDDSVRLLYNDLYLKDLDDTVSLFSGLSPIYQVVVEDGSKGPDVAIAVEGDDCSIEEEFLQILKEKSSQFDHLSDFGCPVKLSVVPRGTIERLGRTGKVRRIVDRRSR
jgi:phenylacetate-coenzyme A ligase PaaK-like adenylate-forming protein